ncbi:MAG: tetratricopeptide repeat protein [Thermodesulfobacteriota bacterium]
MRVAINLCKDNIATYLFCFLLLSLFVIQAVTSIKTKSATADEPSYLETGKHIISQLQKDEAGAILHPPLSFYTHGFLTKPFTFKNDEDRLFWARMSMMPYAIILGLYVFLWTNDLYGRKAALIALSLYSFSPNIIANAPLITTDTIFTCFFMVTLYHFWRYSSRGKRIDILLSGIALGLALLSKYTAILLLPILLILTLAAYMFKRDNCRIFFGLLIAAIVALLVLNIGYGFKGSFLLVGSHRFSSHFFSRIFELPFLRDIPLPIPKPFIYGVDFQLYATEAGYPNFLMGMRSTEGWWYYFPIAFLIKTPVALLVLLVLVAIFDRKQYEGTADKLFLIIPFFFLFFYFSMFSKVNGALRYILPVYPLSFIFAGKWVLLEFRRRWIYPLVTTLLIGWYLMSSISIYPHYLAYFNEIIGGPGNGYKYLGASDLDWGQDVKLARTSTEALKMPACYPAIGKIAIQSNKLQGAFYRDDCYGWLRRFKPTDYIGYSIPVFDLTVEDFERTVLESPKDASAHTALGWIYYQIGFKDNGIKELDKAIIEDPTLIKAMIMKGIIYYNEYRYEQALFEFRRAIDIDPRDPKVRYWLALTYDKMGLSDVVTRSAYKMAVAMDALSWYDKDIDIGRASYQRRLEKDPDNPKLHNNLGFLYWFEGEPDAAIEEFKKAIVLCPNCGDVYGNLAYVSFEIGEYKTALYFLQKHERLMYSSNRHFASRVNFGTNVRETTFMLDDWLILPPPLSWVIALKEKGEERHGYSLAIKYLKANKPFEAMVELNRLGSDYITSSAFQKAKWKIENW